MSQDIINNRFLEESVFAIADGYCVINLTKNIVRGSMYQVINGKKYNLNEQLGLPENSSVKIHYTCFWHYFIFTDKKG